MKQWVLVVVIITSILWVHAPLLQPGLPFTHDSQMHLARFANYYLALKQGQFPPRLAPNLNNTFGYPVLNFNYPLANVVATLLIVVNIPIEDTLKIISLLSLIASGTGMFFLIRSRFGNKAGLLASLLYVFNPYQFNLIYVRGTIGETISFGLLPWLLLAMKRTAATRTALWTACLIGLSWAYLLAHNIIVLFSLPLLVGYGLWLVYGSWSRFWHLFISGVLAAGMSLFFWLPALMEKKWTTLDAVPLSRLYFEHFPTLSQLLTAPWGWGFSWPGPVDGLSFHLGLIQILVPFLAIFILSLKYGKPYGALIIIGWLTVIFLMMLSVSYPLWERVPALWYVQFPWRLLFFFQVGAAVLAGFVVHSLQIRRWTVFLLALLIIFLGRTYTTIGGTFSFPDEYWLTTGQTSSLSDENMPIEFNKGHSYSLLTTAFVDSPVYATPAAEVMIDHWTGSDRRYTVSATTDTVVVERTAFFPGWELSVNGSRQEIMTDIPGFPGLIGAKLPAGTHTVETIFTEHTPARMAGDVLSLISVLATVIMLVVSVRR